MKRYSAAEEHEMPGDAELVHALLTDNMIPWGEKQVRHAYSPRIAKLARARREREREFRQRAEGK